MAQHEQSSKMDNSSTGAAGEMAQGIQEGVAADAVDSSLLGLGRAALMSKSTKPKVPENFNNLPTKPRLKALKQYIGSFQYRLNLQTNFNAHKLRPLARIMDTARMIVYAPQPIKCVEAVFVALYLTAGLPDVERVPLGFKTKLYGQVYQHIVLLVQHGGKWGAFGISRCPDLMNKDLIFDSMSSVIENFKTAYESQGHIVLKVRVGLPVEHSIISPNFVCWRHLNLNLKYTPWAECVDAIDKHAAKGKRLWDLWILSGKGEDPHKSSAIRKAPLDTKVSPFNDKAKKKKKLASRDATPMKAKSVAVVASISSEAASSSTRASAFETSKSTEVVVAASSSSSSSSSSKSKCSETAVVAACPATVGNSKLRMSRNNNQASLETGDAGRGTKLMRAVPRSTTGGIILDQILDVSRGFLRTKYFKETPESSSHGVKLLPTTQPNARRQMVVVRSNPLFTRIPVRISYQTLNAEALLHKSPRLARVG